MLIVAAIVVACCADMNDVRAPRYVAGVLDFCYIFLAECTHPGAIHGNQQEEKEKSYQIKHSFFRLCPKLVVTVLALKQQCCW